MQNEKFNHAWEMNEECFEIIDTIKHLSNLLSGTHKTELNQALSKIDRKITDIEHYIEFNALGVVDGYKAYKMLRLALAERRDIKMELDFYNRFSCMGLTSKAMNKLIASCENGSVPKSYVPRELPELFQKEV